MLMLPLEVVQALKAGIDVAALEQDVAAAVCLQDLAAQLALKEAALTRCTPHHHTHSLFHIP